MAEIIKNDFNLNISRYISTAIAEEEVNLQTLNAELVPWIRRFARLVICTMPSSKS